MLWLIVLGHFQVGLCLSFCFVSSSLITERLSFMGALTRHYAFGLCFLCSLSLASLSLSTLFILFIYDMILVIWRLRLYSF